MLAQMKKAAAGRGVYVCKKCICKMLFSQQRRPAASAHKMQNRFFGIASKEMHARKKKRERERASKRRKKYSTA
jgi:predicted RNA-binding protein YlxR (DUF448 family)